MSEPLSVLPEISRQQQGFTFNERSQSVAALSQKEAFRAAFIFDVIGRSTLFPIGIYSYFARKGI